MKECPICNKTLPLTDFYLRKDRVNQYLKGCRKCRYQRCKVVQKKYLKQYYKDVLKKYRNTVEWKRRHNLYLKEYRKTDNYRTYLSNYRKKDYYKNYTKNYIKNRRKNNVQYNLACRLRGRLRDALRNNYKNGSAVKLLGCSILHLKNHLESKFQKGMSWDNFSQWHVDHIKPLSRFDLTKKSQLKKVCHYTNLQPLWPRDNIKKGNKLSTT
jgi:hypothetical protein